MSKISRCFCTRASNFILRSTRHQIHTFSQQHIASEPQVTEIAKVVKEAESVVQYKSPISLNSLLSTDLYDSEILISRVLNLNHPLKKISRQFLFEGNYEQLSPGLITLLLVKSLSDSVSPGQQQLIEIADMIQASQILHRAVVNLDDNNADEDLEFGNKVAVLSGDYLLASACVKLATLCNCEIVGHISKAIEDMQKIEFISVPSKACSYEHWQDHLQLCNGSLLSACCRSAMILPNLPHHIQKYSSEFGYNFAVTWQACMEVRVLLSQKHLDSRQLEAQNQIGSVALPGDNIDRYVNFCLEMAKKMEKMLKVCPENPASLALQNIIIALTNF